MFVCVYSSYHLKLSFPHLVDAENLQIVLDTQKIPTKIKPPKKYLPNFPTQKNPESKISNPKTSFDHPRLLKSRVPLLVSKLFSYLKMNK